MWDLIHLRLTPRTFIKFDPLSRNQIDLMHLVSNLPKLVKCYSLRLQQNFRLCSRATKNIWKGKIGTHFYVAWFLFNFASLYHIMLKSVRFTNVSLRTYEYESLMSLSFVRIPGVYFKVLYRKNNVNYDILPINFFYIYWIYYLWILDENCEYKICLEVENYTICD